MFYIGLFRYLFCFFADFTYQFTAIFFTRCKSSINHSAVFELSGIVATSVFLFNSNGILRTDASTQKATFAKCFNNGNSIGILLNSIETAVIHTNTTIYTFIFIEYCLLSRNKNMLLITNGIEKQVEICCIHIAICQNYFFLKGGKCRADTAFSCSAFSADYR
ncbi:MAG: hypothetical protein BWZ00_01753 [Bacteroidetes bacterium ADurb.BinA174]|nr:MAG: hypothetical protein BWZ00_01753 [Bacteroidetes bacterium ADurb.BinA174]